MIGIITKGRLIYNMFAQKILEAHSMLTCINAVLDDWDNACVKTKPIVNLPTKYTN